MDVASLIQKEALRRGLSPRTIDTYTFCVGKFLRWTKKEPICIKKKDIHDYLDYLLEKGSCGNTLNVYLNSLRFFFQEILGKRLMFKIKFSKVPKKLPIVLTKEEVKQLINSIKNEKHRLMIELMYSAGLRVSELTNLRVEDLELEKGFGWVRCGKGRKDRLFILSKKVKAKLIGFMKKERLQYESFLFIGRKGLPMHPRSVQEIAKKAAKKTRIKKKVTPHTMRHSFATHLIEDGYDIVSVQSLLGHSSAETTMIYIHMSSPRIINVKSPYDNL